MKIIELKDHQVALLACGSFNPPTRMHLKMFEMARDYLWKNFQVKAVEGIMSPVADTFGKPNLINAKHRFLMSQLATQNFDWIRADSYECELKEWSRTISVLEYHQNKCDNCNENPGLRIVMLCGADLIDSFTSILPNGLFYCFINFLIKNLGEPLWSIDQLKKIITEFGIVVVGRIGATAQDSLTKLGLSGDELSNIIMIDGFEKTDISSTKIRNRLFRCEPIDDLTFENVAEYIRINNLYK